MADRLLIGATLMGVSMIDTFGLDAPPSFIEHKETLHYEATYNSKSECLDALDTLYRRHRITNLKCEPDAK